MNSRSRTAFGVLALAAPLLVACGTAKSATPLSSVSSSTLPVITTTTTAPVPMPTAPPRRVTSVNKRNPSQWPVRPVAFTGQAQDIAPTSDDVYWLNVLVRSFTPQVVQVVRYDPTTGQMTKGPSISGLVAGASLTVTGGWVWVVIGTANSVVVEQLNPSTLAVTNKESLPVKDGVSGQGVVYPVLTATVDGPLWVAGGDDLWASNPTTGAPETEFDTGNNILSMSTDPTGSLLYTGGQTTAGGMIVTEYNAQTGLELQRSDKPLYLEQAIGTGSVSATNSGVWISVRYGMAGGAFELSDNSLSEIASPPSRVETFGTYDQIMGVGSSVSEGTLWLTNLGPNDTGTLTCADPTTGAVRASEQAVVAVFAPIAQGQLLYAVTASGGVVVITPPAKCFGSPRT